MSPHSRANKWLVSLYRRLLRRMRAHIRLHTRAARKQAAGLLRCHIELLHPRFLMSFTPVGIEFLLNQTTTDSQLGTAAVVDSAGTLTAVWQSNNQDGSGWGIYGRQFDAAGSPLGPDFRVNQTTAGDQIEPAIALSSNGDIVVVWSSTQSGQREIYARLFDSTAAPIKGELLINSIDGSNPTAPSVAIDSTGDFEVAWEASDSADSDGIYFRIVGSDYKPKGSDKLANSTIAGSQADASVGVAPNGNFIVAWTDFGGTASKVRAQRFKADGKKAGGEFLVGTAGSDVEEKPSVGVDSLGNFAIAWQANYFAGNSWDVDVRRYNAAGTALDANPIIVNTNTNGAQNDAAIGMRGDGKFLVAYTTGLDYDGTGNGVYAQGFNADGTRDGGEFLVNTTTMNNQKQSFVTFNGNYLAIAWEGNGTGDTSGVFAQNYVLGASSANQSPTISAPSGSTVAEDTSLTFSSAGGNAILVADPDGGSATEQLTLTATHGILTLAQTAGLSFTSGASGTSSMTFTGSIAAMNAALDGAIFTPAANYSGSASIQVTINDQGNSGTGGSLSSTVACAVTVTPVADRPTISNATTTSGGLTTSGLVVSRNAADGAEVTHYKITGITNGTLYLNDGTTQIVVGQFITAAQGAAGLRFRSSSGSDGTVSVQASTSNADVGLGGSIATATIDVTSALINHLPPAQTTQDGTPLIFSQATGNPIFISDGSNNAPYTLDLSVNHGVLTLGSTSGISFSSGNGVNDTSMSFQGSIAQINNALNGMTFTPTAGYSGSAVLQTDTTDGGLVLGLLPNTTSANLSITIQPIAHTPSVTGATTNENEQSTAGLVITPNAADVSAGVSFKITNITGGTLFLSDGVTAVQNGEFLSVATGTAGLKFTPSPNSTADGSFDVQSSLSSDDSGLAGSVVTAAINVNGVPLLTPGTPELAYTEGDGAVAVDGGLAVVDADSANLTGATLRLFGYVSGEDTLGYTNQNGITGTWDATGGTLTLTGTASLAQYQAALRSITYANSSSNPDTSARAVEFSVSDGLAESAPVTVGIRVSAIPKTPVVTGALTNESEQSSSGLVITPDPTDTAEVSFFKITNITGGTLFKSDGVTAINAGNFITLAEGASGLRFTPGSTADGSFNVEVSTTGDNAGLRGPAVTAAISVNSRPVLAAGGPGLSITENAAPVALAPLLTVTDADDALLTGAVVAVNGYVSAEDLLGFSAQSGITGSWDSTTGELTLTGTATLAQYQAALRSVTYRDLSDNPHTSGAVEITVSDGRVESAPITVGISVTRVNDPLTISFPSAQSTVEDTPIALAGSNRIIVYDPDGPNLSLDVKLSASKGSLTLASTAGLIISRGDGNDDFSVNFTGTISNIGAAFDGMIFSPADDFFGAASIKLRVKLSSSNDWGHPIFNGTLALAVSPAAETPLVTDAVTTPGAQTSSGLVVTPNSADGSSVIAFKISNIAGGSLYLHDGVTTLSENDFITVAEGAAGLRFTPDNGAMAGTFDVQASITPDNSGLAVTPATAHINVKNPPVVSVGPGMVVFTEGNAPAQVLADAVVTLSSGATTLDGATISITGGYAAGQDQLRFTAASGITGAWDASTGQIVLSGSASVTSYQTVIRSITFGNNSQDPDETARRVEVTVREGTITSAVAGRQVNVAAVNTAPTTTVPGMQQAVTDVPLVFSPATGNRIYVADVDAHGASIRVLLKARRGAISLARTDALTLTIGTGSGEVITEFNGTVAAVNAALNGLTFTASRGFSGLGSLQVIVNDLGNTGTGGERIVDKTIDISIQSAPTPQPVPTSTPTPTPTTTPTPTPTPTSTVSPQGPTVPPVSHDTTAAGPAETSKRRDAEQKDRSKARGSGSSGTSDGSTPAGLPVKAIAPMQNRDGGGINEFESGSSGGHREQSDSLALRDLAEATFRSRLGLFKVERDRNGVELLTSFWAGSNQAAPIALAGSSPMWVALDQMHGAMTAEKEVRVIAGAASFVSVGMSVVYFFWAVRAGSMLSSLLSSIPAWKSVDPLPILDQMGNGERDEDTEGLDTLVGSNRKRVRSTVFDKFAKSEA